MRKLTEQDLNNIIGSTIEGYIVESARIKEGPFVDSSCYGFLLGKNQRNQYVTWQFHLLDDESVSCYWGHYHMENREAAINDYNTRDRRPELKKFWVTIIETLEKTVEVEADDQEQAQQTAADGWKNSEYILDADNLTEVAFEAVPVNM